MLLFVVGLLVIALSLRTLLQALSALTSTSGLRGTADHCRQIVPMHAA